MPVLKTETYIGLARDNVSRIAKTDVIVFMVMS